MAYFGRSTNVWNIHGKSYADLSGKGAAQPSTSGLSGQEAVSSAHKAGAPSGLRPRGAGSFLAQDSWAIGASSSAPLSAVTEAKSHYKAPPEGLKREVPFSYESQFPHPHYPHEFKTINQDHYRAEAVKVHVRAAPIKHTEGGDLILKDVPPQYGTAYGATFVGPEGRPAEVKAGRRAGNPATLNSGYNIITGGGSLSNSAFERFEGGQDYRRHR